ncbi:MAG: spore maturation protein [Clostridia bacterium]|nr:spore maturation protein [Clostridia bacterium]
MKLFGAFVIPFVIVFIMCFGICKGTKIFDCFLEGAKGGLVTVKNILPSIVGLLVAVGMLKASGGLDIIVKLLSPIGKLTGIPEEIMPLAVLNPISGGGALSMYEMILEEYGPDSFQGRAASVMMGATETTFYAIAVYFGSVGIKKTRHTVFSALMADFVSFVASAWTVKLFFGS